jgi:GT2 family glycosyltransferase
MLDTVRARPQSTDDHRSTGIVVIGRNEGERLKCCLKSLRGMTDRMVYVDSGSSDDSVAVSRNLGIDVVELDVSTPFTAARARNTGFRRLLNLLPSLEYVFFVDGDCEVVDGWLDVAAQFLDQHPDVGVVWGRRREKYPERSIYNLLVDIEWDWETGEVKICGGDALMRVDALKQVNGFRSELICGEEPELCVRLRQANWRIWHVSQEMTRHDVALYRFSQWWRRSLRGGYGFAQGADLHGAPPVRHCVRESRRIWMWGIGVPVAACAFSLVLGWPGLLMLGFYPLQAIRLALLGKRSLRENWLGAIGLVVGKFPEALGQLKYIMDKHSRVQTRLIEYK